MFSGFLVRAQQWRVFASAHSRGLRRDFYASTDNADRFATAHSCGLRLLHTAVQVRRWSLPQRIRAGCDLMLMPLAFADSLCHSAFVRVATLAAYGIRTDAHTLPQRIRAGCDPLRIKKAR